VLAVMLCLLLAACGGGSAGNDTPPVGASSVPVRNAGAVLLGPFLPRLFAMAGYLEDGQFKDRAHQERAVYLLHYAATGDDSGADDTISMVKILCGLALGEPLTSRPMLSEMEIAQANAMLVALLQNWPPLTNTSIEGLREAFIQRAGALQDRNSHLELLVEPKAFDVLLRQLPFSIARVQHPWMQKPVHVTWH